MYVPPRGNLWIARDEITTAAGSVHLQRQSDRDDDVAVDRTVDYAGLEKAGFKVDMQSMDWQTLVTRRTKKDPPDKGADFPDAPAHTGILYGDLETTAIQAQRAQAGLEQIGHLAAAFQVLEQQANPFQVLQCLEVVEQVGVAAQPPAPQAPWQQQQQQRQIAAKIQFRACHQLESL